MLTIVPSINGKRSRCTPSRDTSAPDLSERAHTLSISSRKTIPLSSTDFFASLMIKSLSINLSDSSLTNISYEFATDIFFFLVLGPIAFPSMSFKFIIPIPEPEPPCRSIVGSEPES